MCVYMYLCIYIHTYIHIYTYIYIYIPLIQLPAGEISYGVVACAVLGSAVDRSSVPMGSTLTVDELLEKGVYLSLEESNAGVIPVLSLFQIYQWSGLPSNKDDSVDLNLRTFAELLRAMTEPDKRYDFGFLERFHFCTSFASNSCSQRASYHSLSFFSILQTLRFFAARSCTRHTLVLCKIPFTTNLFFR